jgi:hypothetical protein
VISFAGQPPIAILLGFPHDARSDRPKAAMQVKVSGPETVKYATKSIISGLRAKLAIDSLED